jgi:hypothetical protein
MMFVPNPLQKERTAVNVVYKRVANTSEPRTSKLTKNWKNRTLIS